MRRENRFESKLIKKQKKTSDLGKKIKSREKKEREKNLFIIFFKKK